MPKAKPPAPRDAGPVYRGVSLHRCPYCHEGVRPDEERWAACEGCLARHHEACWGESRRCAACGHAQRLQPGGLKPSRGRRLAQLLAILVGAPFVVVWSALPFATVVQVVPAPATITVQGGLDPVLDHGVRQLRAICNEARRDAITSRRSNYLVFARDAAGQLLARRFRDEVGFVGDPVAFSSSLDVVEVPGDPQQGFAKQLKGSAIPVFDQPPWELSPADRSPEALKRLEVRRDGQLDSDPTRYVDVELVTAGGQRVRVNVSSDGRVERP